MDDKQTCRASHPAARSSGVDVPAILVVGVVDGEGWEGIKSGLQRPLEDGPYTVTLAFWPKKGVNAPVLVQARRPSLTPIGVFGAALHLL